LVRFRGLLRPLRLRSRFRSGFLPSREQLDSGLTRFRSPGLRRLRNGVLHRAKALLLVLLKESHHAPVQVQFRDLLVSVRHFHQGRVDHDHSVIPIRQDLDNLGLSEFLRLLSGLINLVLLGHLHRGEQSSLLAGQCLNPGARRSLLRKENQEALLRAETSQTLRLLDHPSLEVQKARGRPTRSLLSRALRVGRWIGIPRLIRY
jgi:hypothetical protein